MQVTQDKLVYGALALAALVIIGLLLKKFVMKEGFGDRRPIYNNFREASDLFQDAGVQEVEKAVNEVLVEKYADIVSDKTDLTGAFPGPVNEADVDPILKNQNFLEAADVVGSVREPLRNSVIDLRGAPIIPKQVLSPWNNSTSSLTHGMGLQSENNLM
jgi:hypothetical protein